MLDSIGLEFRGGCWDPTPVLTIEQQVLFTAQPSVRPSVRRSRLGTTCCLQPLLLSLELFWDAVKRETSVFLLLLFFSY